MILVHAQAALVHKVGGAHENIVNNFMPIKGSFVKNAIPLFNSAAMLILGTLVCNSVPISQSSFCGSMGEVMEIKP
jgi:hypothetical protein